MGNTTQKEVDIVRNQSNSSFSDENEEFYPGSFNSWKESIPMTYNEDDKCFFVVLTVSTGRHVFRYIVDGVEKTDPNQRSVLHEDGRPVNVIDQKPIHTIVEESNNMAKITEGKPNSFEKDKQKKEHSKMDDRDAQDKLKLLNRNNETESLMSNESTRLPEPRTASELEAYKEEKKKAKLLSGEWGQMEQEFVETKKSPPPLPSHIKYSNVLHFKAKKPNALVVPLHVSVNHLYFSNIEENVDVIGVSQRYKHKFTTLVLFKPRKIFQPE